MSWNRVFNAGNNLESEIFVFNLTSFTNRAECVNPYVLIRFLQPNVNYFAL